MKHGTEPQVIQYISTKASSKKEEKKERERISEDIRNRGNFIYNQKIINKEIEGSLLPSRRKLDVTAENYVTCTFCLGLFKRPFYSSHLSTCEKKTSDVTTERAVKSYGISLLPEVSDDKLQHFKTSIFPTFRHDPISLLAKTDSLIVNFGAQFF